MLTLLMLTLEIVRLAVEIIFGAFFADSDDEDVDDDADDADDDNACVLLIGG